MAMSMFPAATPVSRFHTTDPSKSCAALDVATVTRGVVVEGLALLFAGVATVAITNADKTAVATNTDLVARQTTGREDRGRPLDCPKGKTASLP